MLASAPAHSPLAWVLPGLLLAGLLLAACRPPPTDPPSADTLTAARPAPMDTVPAETVAAPPPPATLPVDTTSVATPDSLTAPELAAELAALRSEVQRLREALDDPERPGGLRRLFDADRDTTRAGADTLATTERIRETARGVRQFGVRFVVAVLLLVLTMFAVRGLVGLLDTLAERNAARRLFFKKLVPIVRLLTWSLALYVVLSFIFGLTRSSLLAAATALGVAIGFAGQDVLKNIFGGIIIIFDQPFQVGDKISVGGTYGEVVSIGLRSTRIVTPDDNLVSVPNSQVVEGQVANANAGALDCQVVVDLYLPGWVDVMKAKAIAYEAAAHSRYVYLDKPIVVNVKDEFKETFLTHLKVKAYVLDTRYEFIFASDVTEAAKTEFIRHGLLYPIHDLHPGLGSPDGNGQASTENPAA